MSKERSDAAKRPLDRKVMPDPVCEVRGTKHRKWLYWYGKDWEANPVGATFYSAEDVKRLEAERDRWKQQAEALARAVLMDEAGNAA